MNQIADKLTAAAKAHQGTDLGGLLQIAALHIQSQQERIEDDAVFIANLRQALQNTQTSHERLRVVIFQAYSASSGVAPSLAEEVKIEFIDATNQKPKKVKK